MTEKIKDRLTKLLEAHRLAVENELQDQGSERKLLEEQIQKHVIGQDAPPEPVSWPAKVRAASEESDPAAARLILEAALGIIVPLMPLNHWHEKPEPAPVLWGDNQWEDAVLSAGEIALLSGPGGIGKSYLALAWALAAYPKP